MKRTAIMFAAGVLTTALTTAASAQTVAVTPLGSHDGEFCRLDRAMIFQDPDGTRILYDAGRTVAGAGDARLGNIDAVLVSHMHGDHLGDRHIAGVNQGTCAKPEFPEVDAPAGNSVKIAAAKSAKMVTGSEMASFFAGKLKREGGDPKASMLVRFGASKMVGGVKITTVPAVHSNGVHPAFIGGELGAMMKEAGLTGYAGPPTGYVLTFTNGLVVYLSGDTGVTAEQDTVVRGLYGAELAVINIGDTFTTGPAEAAHVMNNLVKPKSVIPSHANEPATEGGKVRAGTRTAAFLAAISMPGYVPLSGKTMTFDGAGACVGGC